MNLNYLKVKHKNSLLELLQNHEEMFDGTYGKYIGSDYAIELKEDAKSYHAKPFPIPNSHEPTLKKEVNRLIKIGVLKKSDNSQSAAPTFKIPEINGTVRFIYDFRELNKRMKRKPFSILKHSRFITQTKQINVYIDHKNLAYKSFNTERLMKW